MDVTSLPLDWTRISRKRSVCCTTEGASCRHRRGGVASGPSPSHGVLHKGQVIVCLTDSDPEWFQAYFFGSSSDVIWGLLGVQKEIDDCLQCAEGGYRVIDLKVTYTNPRKNEEANFTDVEWTGGDMMDLKHANVAMQAQRILTGDAALPVLQRLFQGQLVRRIRDQLEDEEDAGTSEDIDMLQVFPDLAIVIGDMEVRLPVASDTPSSFVPSQRSPLS